MGIETEIMRKIAPGFVEGREAPAQTESGRLRHETAARVETVHACQDRFLELAEALGFDPRQNPRQVTLDADGTLVYHGSIYGDETTKGLVPNLRVEGVLNLKKVVRAFDIPADVSAFAFVGGEAMAAQANKVTIVRPEADKSKPLRVA